MKLKAFKGSTSTVTSSPKREQDRGSLGSFSLVPAYLIRMDSATGMRRIKSTLGKVLRNLRSTLL